MESLTAEQIAEKTDNKEGRANIRAINKIFRYQDQSYLWPISNKFNATDRAIRQARKFQKEISSIYGLEYCLLLDNLISNIVNNTSY